MINNKLKLKKSSLRVLNTVEHSQVQGGLVTDQETQRLPGITFNTCVSNDGECDYTRIGCSDGCSAVCETKACPTVGLQRLCNTGFCGNGDM